MGWRGVAGMGQGGLAAVGWGVAWHGALWCGVVYVQGCWCRPGLDWGLGRVLLCLSLLVPVAACVKVYGDGRPLLEPLVTLSLWSNPGQTQDRRAGQETVYFGVSGCL